VILADRYRIVGLLGRGGMGEVYRAEDLKLGQAVALKFLPEGFENDPGRLERFLDEVRLARRVSHSKVCRVHDVGEVDGQHFVSMEYVDGEDLASLLRQIGRLPRDKATDIARQICAGLAAVHEEGILHRDLKPSNVMIDGRGRVRLTDFGLAALSAGIDRAQTREGTPAYMAPEQLAGREVTVRSDLYSLGLVLYEIFTGRRAFGGDTPAEMLRVREESTPTSPARIVEGLEPSVERVILRCLEADPRQRPPSALAVVAALPGGDPLAAALAAGETPSPEIVAESGTEGDLRPAIAWSILAVIFLGIVVVMSQAGTTQLVRQAPLEKSPDVLVERAREILTRAGYPEPPQDEAFAFGSSRGQLDHLAGRDSSPARWTGLATEEPSALRFGYRQSPRFLVPLNPLASKPSGRDPPSVVPGMKSLTLDSRGRLLAFQAVAPSFEESPGPAPEPDWAPLFEEAGLDFDRFTPVAPQWVWPIHSDVRTAWEGAYPGSKGPEVRVEAASARGRPVLFRIVFPWDRPSAAERETSTWLSRISGVVFLVGALGTLAAALLIARANLRRGRGDRRGAGRLAFFLLAAQTVVWLFEAHHVPDVSEVRFFFGPLAGALLSTVAVWILYVALEPLARKHWPRALVSWVRLLDGRFRDPLVGRDCLIGCLLGALLAANSMLWHVAPSWWGSASPPPYGDPEVLATLNGLRQAVGVVLRIPIFAVQEAMLDLVFLVLLRALLRKTWIAATVFFLVGTLVQMGPEPAEPVLELLRSGISVVLFLGVFFRFGLLPTLLGLWFVFTLESFPLTFDLSAWYGSRTLVGLAALVGVAGWAFRVSLAGRPAVEAKFLE
jgi:serine/threonine-protein kinase